MRILITGGSGFIGSHLTERLLKEGHHITIIDDFSTGSIQNIQRLLGSNNIEVVRESVLNETVMSILVEKSDVIYHLAAAVGVQLIIDKPVQTMETNIRGTEVVLNLANIFRKRILIASTSEVYGKNTNIPFKEDDDRVLGSTVHSRWSYSCSKAIDEFLGLAYYNENELPVILVRFFNTVGPRQTGQYGMVVPRFVRSALLNEPITVYGTGKQSRCFTHVSDVIDGITALMDEDKSVGQVYNIGSQEEISIENLAQRAKEITGSSSEIKCISYDEAYGKGFDDMERRVPDLTRINNLVGYSPKISLEQILIDVRDHLKKELGI